MGINASSAAAAAAAHAAAAARRAAGPVLVRDSKSLSGLHKEAAQLMASGQLNALGLSPAHMSAHLGSQLNSGLIGGLQSLQSGLNLADYSAISALSAAAAAQILNANNPGSAPTSSANGSSSSTPTTSAGTAPSIGSNANSAVLNSFTMSALTQSYHHLQHQQPSYLPW